MMTPSQAIDIVVGLSPIYTQTLLSCGYPACDLEIFFELFAEAKKPTNEKSSLSQFA